MSTFLFFFGVPTGAVWSNILAEPIIFALTLFVMWLFRDKIGKHFAAWLHKHHTAHVKHLAEQESKDG